MPTAPDRLERQLHRIENLLTKLEPAYRTAYELGYAITPINNEHRRRRFLSSSCPSWRSSFQTPPGPVRLSAGTSSRPTGGPCHEAVTFERVWRTTSISRRGGWRSPTPNSSFG
jgi:hypothetical protein